MVFSSVTFLFYFLPIVLGLYALVAPRMRNNFLLLASVVFYVWGAGAAVFVLLLSVGVDYAMGLVAGIGVRRNNPFVVRFAIIGSVIGNLALLCWFRYSGWLAEIGDSLGVFSGAAPDVVLPVGMAFFTLQSMSYTFDVARGRSEAMENPFDFALYILAFPQLIAGPIVRLHQIEPQLRSRRFSTTQLGEGAVRFGHGLVKKVVIADTIGAIADASFASDDLSMGAAWLGAFAFTLQIYFDFSGYADMAIGLGRMFGLRLPENFDRPYSAVSVADFWRRWHITLTRWFRDYVYLPLGGSQGSRLSNVFNLVVVFLLAALWHGGGWGFLAWGLFHAVVVVGERLLQWAEPSSTIAVVARRATTFLIVLIGWVLFRADSFGDARTYLGAMFTPGDLGLSADVARAATTRALLTLAVGATVVLLPRQFTMGRFLLNNGNTEGQWARFIILGLLLPFALLLVVSGPVRPFIFFEI